MSNPAFIVDGFTEKRIIQELCPGRPIRRTDLNGNKVAISAIAKKIASLIRLLSNRYYPIIILIDKEDRSISFLDMANQIRDALEREGLQNEDIKIGIADRMIENWIIGDWGRLTGNIRTKPINTDGINGASTIKKVLGSYQKTTDGVDLFLTSRQGVIYQNSPSFRHFVDQINETNCAYLDFEK